MAADVPEQEQGDQEESGTWSPAGHRDRGVVTPEACGAFRNAVTENRIEMDFCRYFLTIVDISRYLDISSPCPRTRPCEVLLQ